MERMTIRCCCDCSIIGNIPVPEGLKQFDHYKVNGLDFEVNHVCSLFDHGLALKSADYPEHLIEAIDGFQPGHADALIQEFKERLRGLVTRIKAAGENMGPSDN